jgi:hypothetical protein
MWPGRSSSSTCCRNASARRSSSEEEKPKQDHADQRDSSPPQKCGQHDSTTLLLIETLIRHRSSPSTERLIAAWFLRSKRARTGPLAVVPGNIESVSGHAATAGFNAEPWRFSPQRCALRHAREAALLPAADRPRPLACRLCAGAQKSEPPRRRAPSKNDPGWACWRSVGALAVQPFHDVTRDREDPGRLQTGHARSRRLPRYAR